jgi:phospholipid/cholesterol/gamma-HCH transport system substrate-binding protein/paraquat-inducible protein B
VLGAVAILFVSLFILGGRSLFQSTYVVETFFDESVAGLEVGSPVKFRGVPIGQVTSIVVAARVYDTELMTVDRRLYIVVRMKLMGVPDKAIDTLPDLIAQGLRVQTQLAGITGQLFLALDLLDPTLNPPLPLPWKPDYPYVPSARSLTNKILTNAQSFLASLDKANVESLGQNLNRLVLTMEKSVHEAQVQKLADEGVATLKAIRGTAERTDKILAQGGLDETLRNLRSASARLDKMFADPAFETAPRDVAVVTARLRKLAENGEFDELVNQANQALARLDEMIGANQYDVRATIEDLRVSMDNLRALTEVAKRYPAGLIFGEPPKAVSLPSEKR